MTKSIYIKLVIIFSIINLLFIPRIIATSENSVENNKSSEIVTDINTNTNKSDIDDKNNEDILTDEEKKQIEELNNIIKELLKSLKSKLKTIDEKIEYIRTIKEYETYPAVRLNIDTPIFGLASISNSKLKVRQEVSATDIAKGYSIRYIIKNNSIKLPDKYIAGIILTTKDVKFDENISLNDANASVIKLMQYSKTADNVIEFLNNQTNKALRGYIDKSKNETITQIKRKLSNLNDDLLEQDEKLVSLKILLVSEEKKSALDKELETFSNISKRIKENKRKVDDILITNEDLIKVQKDVLELESIMIDYSINLDNSIKSAKENIDEKQILLSIQSDLKLRKKSLEEIVNNSNIKKVILNEEILNDNESTENTENVENIENTENKTIEEIKVYDVVSKEILKEIEEEIIKVIDEKVKYYAKELSVENDNKDSNDNSNNNDKDLEEKKISQEEKNQIADDLIKLYKEFLLKENKFYLDNINNTLDNTTSKIYDLSKYTKSDILNEMRYIYLEIPSSLENYLDGTNLDSYVETRKLSNNLNKELNELLKVYVKVDGIYDELNVNSVKNND